jgi:transcriptional regulator with XRE-family HTH domain
MARTSPQIRDPELATALRAALERGAFSLAEACRVLRSLRGDSQEDFAAHLGLNVKVIKALESGKGNPRYDSLEKIAGAVGLRVAFVKAESAVELLDPDRRAADERRRRLVNAEALAAGRISESELHERSAMRVDEVVFELPKLA